MHSAPPDPWEEVTRRFAERFGGKATIRVRAPGRVNLIGEHTDYNDGLVLPVAIDRAVWIAARPNQAGRVRIQTLASQAFTEFSAVSPERASLPAWAKYPQGVAVTMAARGIALAGVDAVIGGDLPIGAGLSSSAAFEVACALMLEHAANVRLPARERALLCHAAEITFVGVPCGIMDQFACALAHAGHALFLDCRSQETHHIPLPRDVVLAVCDTGVRRALGDSAYATRQEECAQAVRWMATRGHEIASLRDLTRDDLRLLDGMPDPLRRRARHVISENARVVEAATALENGALDRLRAIFLASHASLRDDYEVSSPELDAMVETALATRGCLAARMTGAGFGGSAVALVERAQAGTFVPTVQDAYRRRTGREGSCFTSEAVDGARLVQP